MTRIAAMLAWFNEDPAILHRAVTSLEGFADEVVAIDGGWDLYPEAKASSPIEQAHAIWDAACGIGIKASVWPGQHWTGQVQKRHRLLFLAANGRPDWVMPLDADWELIGDKQAARAELAQHAAADAIRVPMFTPLNPAAELDDVAATQWHKNIAGATIIEPFLMRNLQGMRVEHHHWIYTGVDRHGARVALWGNEGNYPQAQTENLDASMQITHHCLFRDQRTIQANRVYCEQRTDYIREHGIEP